MGRSCHCNIVFLAGLSLSIEALSVPEDSSVRLYFGSGCFFARQHLFVSEFEQKSLGRKDADLTAIAGYAGSTKTGPKGAACYHNSQNFADYNDLGRAEVVEVEVPLSFLEIAFSTYFGAFIPAPQGKWFRPDYYDMGAQYRSLVGIPGGVGNDPVMKALRSANVHNLTLKLGHGSDPDTLSTNTVFIMDSDQFGFIQAEVCLQFHDDSIAKFPDSYHQLVKGFQTRGRVLKTGCPDNFICNTNNTASSAPEGLTVAV